MIGLAAALERFGKAEKEFTKAVKVYRAANKKLQKALAGSALFRKTLAPVMRQMTKLLT